MSVQIESTRKAVKSVYDAEVCGTAIPKDIPQRLKNDLAKTRSELGKVDSFRLGISGIDEGLTVSHTEVFTMRGGHAYREMVLGYPTPTLENVVNNP